MKKLLVLTLGLALIGALGTNVGAIPVNALPGFSAVLPDPFLLTFDENGHGTIAINGGPATTLTGILAADPAVSQAGGGQLVLTYFLPEPVITGDVSFTEPGSLIVSDWLRFTDNAGTISGAATGTGPRMIFYSEFETGETNPDLADKGFPTNLGTGRFSTQLEVGSEGSNGFDYRPGGVPYPQNNQYIGISDVVPEPATVLLMASGLLGLAGWRRYSSRT